MSRRAIDLEAFQDAVQKWMTDALSIPVVWRDQSAPQPELPFASLLIINGPETYAPQLEERVRYNSGAPEGTEIEQTVTGPCRLVVSCQVYVGVPDSRSPNLNATSLLASAKASLSLPSVLAEFSAANIAFATATPILNLDAIASDAFESRANMDVTFLATLELVEETGYIDKVELKSDELGVDVIIDASTP